MYGIEPQNRSPPRENSAEQVREGIAVARMLSRAAPFICDVANGSVSTRCRIPTELRTAAKRHTVESQRKPNATHHGDGHQVQKVPRPQDGIRVQFVEPNPAERQGRVNHRAKTHGSDDRPRIDVAETQ